ncbi:MAG: hypothetical protein WCP39_05150 [Chlamydiota bacterium]
MKKIILTMIALGLGFSSGFAEKPATTTQTNTQESLFYGDLGVGPLPLLVPSFGIGYRHQKNHWGGDVALDVSTIYYATTLKITPAFLYYPTVNLASEFYAGFGLDLGAFFGKDYYNWFSNHHVLGYTSPTLILGKKYRNKAGKNRFFEARIGFPTIGFELFKGNKFNQDDQVLYYPIVYLKYGIEF